MIENMIENMIEKKIGGLVNLKNVVAGVATGVFSNLGSMVEKTILRNFSAFEIPSGIPSGIPEEPDHNILCENVRHKHYHLLNGAVLTICSNLNKTSREIKFGWAVFNPNDGTWIKKTGNRISYYRMHTKPFSYVLSDNEPILTDYISMRTLLMFYAVSKNLIKDDTRSCLTIEMFKLVEHLRERLDIQRYI